MGIRHTRSLFLPLAAACVLTIAAPALKAQQGGPAGPVGGVEQYNLGELPPQRSFVIPQLSIQEVYDSNAGYAGTSAASQGDEVTSISGGLTLQAVARNSVFTLLDSTGGLIYAQQSQPNSVIQRLNFTEKLSLRRWNLLLGEDFSYLPSSGFGLGGQGLLGGTPTGLPGIGVGTGFNPYVAPSQTIVAPNVSQISSVTVVQAQYATTPSSSVNFSGTVGLLHFLGNDLLNSRNVTARFGYDKSFTARDTISFSYLASILDYPSGIPGFTSNYIQVGYRRLIQQRLHLSLSGGPVITHFTPMTGQTTVTGGANLVNWSAICTLDYLTRGGTISVQYNHGVSAGSGFLPGATSDQLTANFTRKFARIWLIGFSGGYSRNSALEQTATAATMNSTFNTWYGGTSVSRPLGHYSNLRFYFNVSRQTGNTMVCVTGTVACAGPIALTEIGGISFTWASRPHPIG